MNAITIKNSLFFTPADKLKCAARTEISLISISCIRILKQRTLFHIATLSLTEVQILLSQKRQLFNTKKTTIASFQYN